VAGRMKAQAFLPGRLNGQYILEGLSAGFMFCLGSLGFVGLDKGSAPSSSMSTKTRCMLIGAGIALILIGYSASLMFLRIKLPYYLHGMGA
jgi:hypothetical protein